jgi:hypothetical protein
MKKNDISTCDHKWEEASVHDLMMEEEEDD